MTIELTGNDLTIADVVACARGGEQVRITDEALDRVRGARARLEERIEAGETIYGVNTGVGGLAHARIPPEEIEALQQNLIRSNAFGVGEPIDEDEARATVLLRLNSLLAGNSGVRTCIVTALRDLLNAGVYPHIPRKGSAGASGDLAPLAHVALVLTGEGQAYAEGERRDAATVLDAAGIDPLTLRAKEGLALINGTSYMAAMGALAVHDARVLVDAADVIGTVSLEAVEGVTDAFRPEIHELRGQPGQAESAARIREAYAGSELVDEADEAGRVHDSYALRCMPQVHGASRDMIEHVAGIVEREVNAVTDNPLVLSDGDVVSGGNFHGQPVALALDALATAVAELSSIAERRIFTLVGGGPDDDLPAFLVGGRPGLNCGFMVPQIVAASLVSENKSLAHPSSVDSVPTVDNQEDHVSMGANAANHLAEIIDNVTTVLAIELFAAYQALDFRERSPGERTGAILSLLEEHVDRIERDRVMVDDLEAIRSLIVDGRVGGVLSG